jgi:hypothetical protein
MPQLHCGKKIVFSFICLIQIARDDGLCEFCVEEVEFLRGILYWKLQKRKGTLSVRSCSPVNVTDETADQRT